MLRTQKSVLPLEFCWVFSRGDTSSSSELLPVYDAVQEKIQIQLKQQKQKNKNNIQNARPQFRKLSNLPELYESVDDADKLRLR